MSKTAENPNIRISPQSSRDRFFREVNEGYARLQADPKAWQEELDERRLWDTTLADGLDSE